MSWYVADSLDQLLEEINTSAPDRSKASDGSIGDADHSSRESDHNPCDCHDAVCARDFTHDPADGFDSYAFADWLRERCDCGAENRVKYIISNSRIASPTDYWEWRPYTGSNPHDHHVHVSVDHPSSVFNNAGGWGWAEETPPEPEPPQHCEVDMIYCISPDGRGWLIGAGVKTFINSPATRDALLAAGVPNAGVWPSSILNEFATRETEVQAIFVELDEIDEQTE